VEPLATVERDGSLAPRPVTFRDEAEQIYLTLYGTGFRQATARDAVVQVGGMLVPVTYAGPQGGFLGLDQVNAGPLPRALAGTGERPVVLGVAGIQSNALVVEFR
jgi:uncharacterized protein (TIGR03437 family)